MFEVSVLQKSYDMKDPESKTKFFQAVAAKIAGFELEIERENYIEAVTGRYQISFEGLRKMVMNVLMQGVSVRKQPVRTQNRGEKDDGIRKSQRLILTWLCEYPKLYQTVSQYIQPEDFSDELYHKVASMLFEQLEKKELNPARIMNQFMDTEQQRTVAQIFNTEVPVETPEDQQKAIKETVRKVMEHGIEQRTANLDPTDIAGLQKLIDAKRRLQELGRLHISL